MIDVGVEGEESGLGIEIKTNASAFSAHGAIMDWQMDLLPERHIALALDEDAPVSEPSES